MNKILRIGNSVYRETPNGDFEVPFSQLGKVRLRDLPYYSSLEIVQLPGNEETYNLSIRATHAGGPGNDDFSFSFYVSFLQAGEAHDPIVVDTCNRKLRHIRRSFREFVDSGILDDGAGNDLRLQFKGTWVCGISYAWEFARQDNPILSQAISPFVRRFKAFLETPELYLFLCHASEDKKFVDMLATYLDSRDIDLWYDKREIKVGDSIVNRINEGLEETSHVVVVLSKTSVKKPWVQKELSSALMKQLKDKSITIIPLLREDCKIPALLADIKYVDCRGDHDAGFQQMIDEILTSRDVITKKELSIRDQGGRAMGGKVINFHSRVENAVVGDNNKVTIKTVNIKKTTKNKYPEGCIGYDIIKANYIGYLITRYHEYKEYDVGKANMNYVRFPANLKTKFKIGTSRTIYNIPIDRFEELSNYIQRRINGTKLANINKGKGITKNYDTFEQYAIENKSNE